MHEKAFRSDSLIKKCTLYENLTSIKISYQIPAISSCLFYLILRELYITLIGILSHTETPAMINCLLGVLSYCAFFIRGFKSLTCLITFQQVPFGNPHEIATFLNFSICLQRSDQAPGTLSPFIHSNASVFSPALLHSIHRQPSVGDVPMPESLHFLVKAAQRVSQSQPKPEGKATVLKPRGPAI